MARRAQLEIRRFGHLSLYALPPGGKNPGVFPPVEEEEGDIGLLKACEGLLEGVFGLGGEEDGGKHGLAVLVLRGRHNLLDETIAPGLVVRVHGPEHAFDGIFVPEGVVPTGADFVEGLRGWEDTVVRNYYLEVRKGGKVQ